MEFVEKAGMAEVVTHSPVSDSDGAVVADSDLGSAFLRIGMAVSRTP